VRQVIIEPRREHSRKPDRIYGDIERLLQGPYLELFSRASPRSGWTLWGDELGRFEPEQEIRAGRLPAFPTKEKTSHDATQWTGLAHGARNPRP
jgi:hypothetical protein